MCVYNWRMKMGTLNFVILGRWVHSNLLVFLFCWLPSVSPTDMLSGPWRRITELLVVKPPCLWALVWPSNSSQAFHSNPSLHANNWVFFFRSTLLQLNLLICYLTLNWFDFMLPWQKSPTPNIPYSQLHKGYVWSRTIVNQHPTAHHPLDARYYSVVDETSTEC
jgi:hypothetical protein